MFNRWLNLKRLRELLDVITKDRIEETRKYGQTFVDLKEIEAWIDKVLADLEKMKHETK